MRERKSERVRKGGEREREREGGMRERHPTDGCYSVCSPADLKECVNVNEARHIDGL